MEGKRSRAEFEKADGEAPAGIAGGTLTAWSYMKNMTEAELEQADVVLAPVETPDEDSEDSWQLPCHSVILSAHSAVFSASKRSVGSLEAELNHEGKRILRLPLSKGAAEILLQHCYGVFDKLYDMSPEQAFELATVSDMQALKGLSNLCDKRLANEAKFSFTMLTVVKDIEEISDSNTNDDEAKEASKSSEPRQGAGKASTRKKDVIDFAILAWECRMQRLAPHCLHHILNNHVEVFAKGRSSTLPPALLNIVAGCLSELLARHTPAHYPSNARPRPLYSFNAAKAKLQSSF